MKHTVTRVVRSIEGSSLMKWATAVVAEICDECSIGICPGEEIALRQEPVLDSGKVRCLARTYCKPCGDLLEDSLVTTEDTQ